MYNESCTHLGIKILDEFGHWCAHTHTYTRYTRLTNVFFACVSREDYENYQDLGEEKEFHFPSKHPSSRSPKPKSKQFKSHHQLVSVCAHCKCPISSSAIISGRMVADQQQQPPRFDNSSTYQKAMEIIYIWQSLSQICVVENYVVFIPTQNIHFLKTFNLLNLLWITFILIEECVQFWSEWLSIYPFHICKIHNMNYLLLERSLWFDDYWWACKSCTVLIMFCRCKWWEIL